MLLQKAKHCLKLVAEDDFNRSSAESVKNLMLQAIEKTPKKEVLLIFGENDMIDDAGMKLIIGLHKVCMKKDLKLVLHVDNANMVEALRLCQLDQLIAVKES